MRHAYQMILEESDETVENGKSKSNLATDNTESNSGKVLIYIKFRCFLCEFLPNTFNLMLYNLFSAFRVFRG